MEDLSDLTEEAYAEGDIPPLCVLCVDE